MGMFMYKMGKDLAIMNNSMEYMRHDIHKFTEPEHIMMPFYVDL